VRFKNYGLAPKWAADFAFLLHGFHYLKDDGVMAIILPHGVVFRGGAEAKIRRKLLDDGHIDNVIGLGARQHIDSRCEIAASLGRGGIVRGCHLEAGMSGEIGLYRAMPVGLEPRPASATTLGGMARPPTIART
jgi:hypothetical protein